MSRWERNLLVLILLISALLSILSMTNSQVWGDDFSSYIMQARSLLRGSPRDFIQHNTFTIQNSSFPPGPIAYPWGYPAMLAPLLALFGLKLLPLKLLNTFFFLCFLYILFLLARRRLPERWALAVTAIFAFSPTLLVAHDQIMSDIPFLFFSTLAILLIEAQLWHSARGAILVGLMIFLADGLRTNGVLLLVPLLVSQARDVQSRSFSGGWRLLALPWLVFAALVVIQNLVLPSGEMSYLSHFSLFNGEALLLNILYYLLIPAGFVSNIPLGLFFLALMAAFILFDLLVSVRRNLVIYSYIGASLVLFILWPENQGSRFVYPLQPLAVLLSGEGLLLLLDRLPLRVQGWARRSAFLACASFLLLSLTSAARYDLANLRQDREIEGPFDPVSRQMFEFVREQTPANSVVIFFKPRLMRLLTARDSFLTTRCEDLPRADYIVLHEKQGSSHQIGNLSICPGISYPIVFNNLRFTVYQVTH